MADSGAEKAVQVDEAAPLLLTENEPVPHQRAPLRAWALLLSGLICWSATGPLYVLLPLTLKLRPFRVALWRYLFAFVPFFGAFLLDVRAHGLRRDQRRQLSNLKSWPLFSALALTTLGGFTFFGLALANSETFALPAGMAALNPFLLVLWDMCWGRAPGPWHQAGLILGILGAALMLGADHLQSLKGTLLALMASVSFTSYAVAADVLSCRLPFTALMSITFGIGAVLAALLTAGVEGTTLGPGPESFWGFASTRYVVTVVTCLTIAYTWALTGMTASAKDLSPLVLAVGIALEPICSCIIIALLEGQIPGYGMSVALVLLVVGSAIIGAAEAVLGKPPRNSSSDSWLDEEGDVWCLCRGGSLCGSPFG